MFWSKYIWNHSFPHHWGTPASRARGHLLVDDRLNFSYLDLRLWLVTWRVEKGELMDRYRSILDTPLNPTFQNAAESSLLRTFRHILWPFRNICNMVPLRLIFSTYVCYSVSLSFLFLFLEHFIVSESLSNCHGPLYLANCHMLSATKRNKIFHWKRNFPMAIRPSVCWSFCRLDGWFVCHYFL